jgi:hypothetical protein
MKYILSILFFYFTHLYLLSQNAEPKSLAVVENYQIGINGDLFDINQKEYTKQKNYFIFKNNVNEIKFLWQDQSNFAVNLTFLNSAFSSQTTKNIQSNNDEILIAATTDSTNYLYYLTYKAKHNLVEIFLRKIDLEGKIILIKNFYSFANTTNIYKIDDNICSMKSNGINIVALLARKMYKSSDGLNHQAGLAMTFNCKTLELESFIENTTSHSFENYIMVDSKKTFIGMELGDGYPRGINLHKFKDKLHKSRLIYTYKTSHATTSQHYTIYKPFPLYTEISSPTKKYYKWSNDNSTYTTLGGIIEEEHGYFVFFTGAPSPAGKSLDNARASYEIDPQNIGFVKVERYFNVAEKNVNCVTEDVILSKGKIEEGGFFGFLGEWTPQRNVGVVWLTAYKDIKKESARKVKCVQLLDGTIVLLWEKYKLNNYTEDFIGVYGVKLNLKGEKISPITLISTKFRLPKTDELFFYNNKLFILNGINAEKKLTITEINFNK